MIPADESELREAIASAQGPLVIAGGGTRPVGKPLQGTALTVSGLAGIRQYEPQALTLVAGAGTPLSAIEAELACTRQRLAFEPMDHRGLLGSEGVPTVGGVVAANVSGPRRVQAGACRDYLLGVRFVDGAGTVIKNGGRVMKNVTGYDLVRLMAGSYGTLGVLTEVAFKVLPEPECRSVLLIYGLSDDAAVRSMSAALTSPFEVTGAAHTPSGLDGDPVTMIRVEGFEDSVSYRTAQLRDRLAGAGDICIETDPQNTANGWRWVRDVESFHGLPGDVWRLSLKPSDAPGLVDRIRKQCEVRILYDWGGGLVWACVAEGTDLRQLCGPFAGHATLVRAKSDVRSRLPVFHPQPAPLNRIADALRAKFDPRQILNPGLMG